MPTTERADMTIRVAILDDYQNAALGMAAL
jgi:hypothetical protein